jgi:foldase protein PrsA
VWVAIWVPLCHIAKVKGETFSVTFSPTNRLVLQEGERLGITVTEEEVDAEIKNVINNNFYGMEDYFYQTLEYYGLTEKAVKDDLKIEIVLRKIVREQITITEEDVREYFITNQEYFNIPEQVEARHILVYTREEAEEVVQLLDNGKDFSEVVEEYSKDYMSVDQGGNLGLFQRGEMVSEFEEIAFNLAINQRSEPVETNYGFHIIEVLSRLASKEVTFEEVKETVEEMMIEELVLNRMTEYADSLWEFANIDTIFY